MRFVTIRGVNGGVNVTFIGGAPPPKYKTESFISIFEMPFPLYPSESLILTRLAARSPPSPGWQYPQILIWGGIRLPPNVKQFISFAKRSLMRKRMYQDFVFSISKFIKNEMSSRIFGMDKIPLRHFSTSFAGAKTTISFRSLTILLVTTLKTSKTFIVSKF